MSLCQAVKRNGLPCAYKAKEGGFCGIHLYQFTATPINDTNECPVCYDEMCSGKCVVLPCKHGFHDTCLKEWLPKKATCPLCRAVVPSSFFKKLNVIVIKPQPSNDTLLSALLNMIPVFESQSREFQENTLELMRRMSQLLPYNPSVSEALANMEAMMSVM